MPMIVFDPPTRKRIQEVREYAKKHRMDRLRLMQRVDLEDDIEDNFLIRFTGDELAVGMTLEEQPCGWCWHVSFCKRNGRGLGLDAVLLILKECGFTSPKILKTWVDPIEGNKAGVLNLILPEHECLDVCRN